MMRLQALKSSILNNTKIDYMIHNKLVRDKVPEHIEKEGGKAFTHIARDDEYWQKLLEKLQEEIEEFQRNQSEEQIADIFEVIECIAEYRNLKMEDVSHIKHEKVLRRGSFKNRIILDETE